MALLSPCRRTPSTMPSSVHSMGASTAHFEGSWAKRLVRRSSKSEGGSVPTHLTSRVEPALRVAAEGEIQPAHRQHAGGDFDDAVELEPPLPNDLAERDHRQHQRC